MSYSSKQILDIKTKRFANPTLIKERVYQLFMSGVTRDADIARAIGWTGERSAATARVYLNQLVDEKRLEKDENGHIIQTPEVKEKRKQFHSAFKEFPRLDVVEKYRYELDHRRGGKPIKGAQDHITRLFTICRNLGIWPEQLYEDMITPEGESLKGRPVAVYWGNKLQDMITAGTFDTRRNAQNKKIGLVISIRGYTQVIRDFTKTHGINHPLGLTDILTGEKQSYGQYSDVLISEEMIARIGPICDAAGKTLLRDYVNFGIETGSRESALTSTKVSAFTFHEDHIAVKAHETKTEHQKGGGDWNKIVARPLVIKQITERWQQRKAAGFEYFFIDDYKGHRKWSEAMRAECKWLWKQLGVIQDYPHSHPIHTLRHFSAHHWLATTQYDYYFVASVCGWKDVPTLVESYGGMPTTQKIRKLHEAMDNFAIVEQRELDRQKGATPTPAPTPEPIPAPAV